MLKKNTVLLSFAEEYKLPFFFGVACFLAAHMAAVTNKFVNPDELEYLFQKGATLDSGRWALALTSFILPDVSMPWIYGVISAVLLSLACCVIIRTFAIKSRILQVLLTAVIVTFPAETLTLTYIFTSAPYALAFLLFCLSVYVLTRGKRSGYIISALLFCFACAVYQAYLSLAASLFVAYIIQRLLNGEWTAKEGISFGLKCLAVMIAGLVVYFLMNKLTLAATGTEYNEYANDTLNADLSLNGLVFSLKSTYLSFFYYFRYKYLQYIPTKAAMLANYALFALVGCMTVLKIRRAQNWCQRLLTLLFLAILPIAINCLLFVSKPHSLMFYSFITMYVLAAFVLDAERERARKISWHDVGALCLALVILCNINYSNKIFLKQKLVYEQSYSFYSTLLSRIKMLPDFSDDDKIALLGTGSEQIYPISEIETKNLISVGDELVSVYSRDKLLKYYLGTSLEVIDETELTPSQLDAALAMPRYPANGAIAKNNGVILVRLD